MPSRHCILIVLFVLLLFSGCARHIEEVAKPETYNVGALAIAKTTDQIVLVAGLEDSDALLIFYEKEDGTWHERLRTKAYIGEAGLGKTKEGDRKTPVGTFHFTKAFGIAPDPGSRMAYTQVDDTYYWVGDSRSKYYNQMASVREGKRFRKEASEHLIDYTKQYQYCLNISYNEAGTPKLGSAIFLHCFGDNPFTTGCVAVHEDSMRTLLRLIGPGCAIVIDSADDLRAL
ncbi:MAG: L,D-transpeptidase family protein [Desulfovibrionaceae bacterium]|nr:L,D-transpeptidase family protein [Desulfovibrionaceae bacterium]